MRFYVRSLALALICLVLIATLASAERKARRKIKGKGEVFVDEGSSELKVEVTHRPDTCDRKSTVGDKIEVHYAGTLPDGKLFDSSFERDPLSLTLGAGQVIPGWDQGLLGMCVDEMRRLTIPPHLAYGDDGYPPVIPPRATLTFVVKMVAIH
jgi:FK506-binding protein 2